MKYLALLGVLCCIVAAVKSQDNEHAKEDDFDTGKGKYTVGNKQSNAYGNAIKFDYAVTGQLTGGCVWQIGEGSKGGAYTKVSVGTVTSGTQCMFLCTRSTTTYNGAILLYNNACYCIAGMDGRDSDTSYLTCSIR